MVRGDSAYGNSTVALACRRAGARFSLVLVKNSTVTKAIAAIPEDAWTPVHYPGAVHDPDTGELISDAEVAEIPAFTAFASTPQPVTARLIVRRVRDQARLDELFPVWRHHPFLTDSLEPAAVADVTHRRHAIIETVFADLIDGPLAHLPSGRFARERRLGAVRGDHPQPAPRPPAPSPVPPRPWPAARPCAARSSTWPPASHAALGAGSYRVGTFVRAGGVPVPATHRTLDDEFVAASPRSPPSRCGPTSTTQ